MHFIDWGVRRHRGHVSKLKMQRFSLSGPVMSKLWPQREKTERLQWRGEESSGEPHEKQEMKTQKIFVFKER